MAKGESRTSRVGGTQGSVLASETERTENCRAVSTTHTVKRDTEGALGILLTGFQVDVRFHTCSGSLWIRQNHVRPILRWPDSTRVTRVTLA